MSLPSPETNLVFPDVLGWQAGTTQIVPSPGAGMRIAIYAMLLSTNASTTFFFENDDKSPMSSQHAFGSTQGSTNDIIDVSQQSNGDARYVSKTGSGVNLTISGGPLFGDIYWKAIQGT